MTIFRPAGQNMIFNRAENGHVPPCRAEHDSTEIHVLPYRAEPGGRHRGVLGHALLKISILGIWHLPVKLEPLSPKMASFY